MRKLPLFLASLLMLLAFKGNAQTSYQYSIPGGLTGRATIPFNYYSIPVQTSDGTNTPVGDLWAYLYVDHEGSPIPYAAYWNTGWIQFRFGQFGKATVISAEPSNFMPFVGQNGKTIMEPTTFTIGFTGTYTDGSGEPYTGQLILDYSWRYTNGGGGRAGGSSGTYQTVTMGSLSIWDGASTQVLKLARVHPALRCMNCPTPTCIPDTITGKCAPDPNRPW